jgi:hypothetical protein
MERPLIHRLLVLFLLAPTLASTQFLIDPAAATRRLNQISPTKTLACEVSPIKPALSFGLRLQTGYRFRLPLNQFNGPRHRLTILTRLLSPGGAPVYLMDNLRVPPPFRRTSARQAARWVAAFSWAPAITRWTGR